MKKISLLFACAFIICGACAQSIQLHKFSDTSKVYRNGDTITILIRSLDEKQENILVSVRNISSTAIRANLSQRVLNRIPEAQYSFCFGNCYEDNFEPVLTGETSVTIQAGSYAEDLCMMDYDPNGQAGTTCVLYTFFNENDRNDSTSVIVKYDDSRVRVAEREETTDIRISAYPNPINSTAHIRINGGERLDQPVLRICNLLGTIVHEEPVSRGNSIVHIDVNRWSNGIYFYSIWDGDRNLSTQKMIISH
jgi:hypothetical protein